MTDTLDRIAARSEDLPCCVVIRTLAGRTVTLGTGEPALTVTVHNKRGERAIRSMNQLPVCEAYIRGDISMDGDLLAAASLQNVLVDRQPWVRLWRHLQPLLFGRERVNQQWIAKHYDSGNLQLLATDEEWHVYTPGTYESESDTLEVGARRKLETAFRFLNLREGQSALDVGFGWGGFLRYCACHKIDVTGITLSRDQFSFVRDLLEKQKLHAKILFQDFFTFKPGRMFDAVSMMGVIEDLSDYEFVMRRLKELVKPGGRVYLDFATAAERFGTATFITKYVWPGKFRMVYLPELISAIARSPFEIVHMVNDKRNYYLWARENYRRWMQRQTEVVQRAGEAIWRTFHIMHAGTASVMGRHDSGVSAYRMVLEQRGS